MNTLKIFLKLAGCVVGAMAITSFIMVAIVLVTIHSIDGQVAVLDRIRWPVGAGGVILGIAVFMRDAKKQRKMIEPEQG